MNLCINNVAFRGNIKFTDSTGSSQEIDTNHIREIRAKEAMNNWDNGLLMITTQRRNYDDIGQVGIKEETFCINSDNLPIDYDRFLKVYDIASRNNVTINYLRAKDSVQEQI